MRIGVVGVGRIGSAHAKVLADRPDVEDVVLADIDEARSARLADQLGCRSLPTPQEVFAADLDGLVVCTATDTHAEMIVAAARAGLPVFCEKPVALSPVQTRAVHEAVSTARVPVQIGFQRRFDAGYTRAREALAAGAIGTLHRVHMVTGDPEPPHLAYIPSSGGLFRDCHIHDFDILHWVTGQQVVEVFALGANRGAAAFAESGDVDNATALLRLADDTLVSLQGSRYNGAGYDVRMELAGTEATYAVGLSGRTPLTSAEESVDFPGGTPWPDFWERFAPAYEAEMGAFLEMVRGTRPSPCTVEEALAAQYVAEAADLSRREGRRVDVAEVAR